MPVFRKIRHLFGKADDTSLRTVIGEQDGVWLYQNNYTLPVGFYVERILNPVESGTGNLGCAEQSGDALGAEQVMNWFGHKY